MLFVLIFVAIVVVFLVEFIVFNHRYIFGVKRDTINILIINNDYRKENRNDIIYVDISNLWGNVIFRFS